jgi:hypothetical protein
MKTIFKRLSVLTIAFLFFNCSSDSTPCVPISCLNGGTSTPDCGCNCPQGYTGSDCSTQITPTKITISKIRVKYFPSKNAGSYWDLLLPLVDANIALPDIYLTLENSSLIEIYRSPTYYKNVVSDGIAYYDFVPSTPINITSVTSGLVLNLWDYDGADSNGISSDDDMGFIVFNLYKSTGGFPSTLTVVDASKSLGFELTLSYTW